MTNCKNFHSRYVLRAMEDHCLNGDAYVAEDILYHRCKERQRGLSYATFKADLAEQIRLGYIHPEGSHLYINRTWRYEEDASKQLVTILRQPTLPAMAVPENLSVNGIALCQEQRAAVELALTNKLSLILGGAGCGKSTLIRAIVNMVGAGHSMVLCAPTGKAARNLEKRTGLSARTVHSALGMHPDEDFLAPVTWNTTQLVVVDEASMMTLEMLAGILHRVPKICRVVLLGDPNQLLSVGSGNVLPDLLALGVPCARLELNHRQDDEAEALLHNVVDFKKLHSKPDLAFDQSFCLHEMGTAEIKEAVTEEAVRRFAQGESVQVLSPYNNKGNLSAYPSLSNILLEPIGHIGIIDPPRFNSFLILVPITFVTIEELLAVTFIFNDLITFKSILVPVIILLTIALPFLRCVNCHFCLPFFFRSLCAYCLCNKFTVIIPLVKWLSVQNRWCYFAPIEFVRLGVHRRSEQRLRWRSAGQQTRLLLRSQNQ